MVRTPSPRTALQRLFDSVDMPIFALDGDGQILYANPYLADQLGVGTNELVGLKCGYTSERRTDAASSIVDAIAPPPSIFLGGSLRSVCELPGDPVRRMEVWYQALPGDGEEVQGVLGIGVRDPASTAKTGKNARRLHRTLQRHRSEWKMDFGLDSFVGTSDIAARIRRQFQLASACRENVLIVGPPGSGKEHLARAIHYAGAETTESLLVPLDCSLLDAELLTTTVTAFLQRVSLLDTAEPPTLLLLDVDRLESNAQTELLGILSIGELGLRALATSTRRLLDRSEDAPVRAELANILGILTIELPPLLERWRDLPFLAQMFVEKWNAASSAPKDGLTEEASEALPAHDWPGNMDELRDAIVEAHKAAEGPLIRLQDLPRHLRDKTTHVSAAARPRDFKMAQILAQVESALLKHALTLSKGNKSKAAKLVGMSRARFLRRIEHFGLTQGSDGKTDQRGNNA